MGENAIFEYVLLFDFLTSLFCKIVNENINTYKLYN